MATTQNWSYKVVSLASTADFWGRVKTDETQQMLNELGRQGWELVSVVQPLQRALTAYFKRPA